MRIAIHKAGLLLSPECDVEVLYIREILGVKNIGDAVTLELFSTNAFVENFFLKIVKTPKPEAPNAL